MQRVERKGEALNVVDAVSESKSRI